MSEEEILYQIKTYDSDVEDIPDEWRMSLDNGKHYGRATQTYDFTKHRYIVEYVSDNYDIHTEIQTLLQENKQLKEDKKKAREYIKHSQSYGTMAQVMPHLKPYVNGDDLLEILGDKENENK